MSRFYINAIRVINNAKTVGLKCTYKKIKKHLHIASRQVDYNKRMHAQQLTKKECQMQKEKNFSYQPKFSILVPLHESDCDFLIALIESVQAQTYDNWELCFSDGSKQKNRLSDFLQPYIKNDARIRYTASPKGIAGIAENTNLAYSLATGDYIVFGNQDDLFEADALYRCAKALNKNKSLVIYTDEDRVDETGKYFSEPNFKPDFNIDLLQCNNYIHHMFVVEKSLMEKAGGLNPAFDGAVHYDFILRCVELTDEICHIPRVLYHWRIASESENPESKKEAVEAGKLAVIAHFKRLGQPAEVTDGVSYGYYQVSYPVAGTPLVSIVIPNKDHVKDLRRCIEAIEVRSSYRNYELIIVENNSDEQTTFDYYNDLKSNKRVKIIRWDGEFNYSKINNFGVAHARGEYILLLNNDTELISADFITQMLGYCQREDVGVVGAKLYYRDNTIQHAGVIVGIGGIAGHAFSAMDEREGIYQQRTEAACDYSAVTAACLMISKELFETAGGLDPKFKVSFNDVDLCLKVRALGKLVVYVPQAKLYHYESKSRGKEDTVQKQKTLQHEMQLFKQKWNKILIQGDPYYNKNLVLDNTDFSIRKL